MIEDNPKSLLMTAEGKGYLAEIELIGNEPKDLLERKDYVKYLSTLE